MPSTATQTISLPGFGLPLKSQPDFTHRFPTALQDVFRRHEYCSLERLTEKHFINRGPTGRLF